MPRAGFTPLSIAPQTRGWDAKVDSNFINIQTLLAGPLPLGLVHKTTPAMGSLAIAGFTVADYVGSYAHMVDAATPATNGYLIFSDGTNWRYQRTHTII